MIEKVDGTPRDFPFAEVAASAERIVNCGGFVLQKWTCGGCGRRISANNVNTFCEHGHCQHCNFVTDLIARGCNFALIQPSRPMTVADVEQALGLTSTGIQ